MMEDPELERAYEGVELVQGIGDPAHGQLCVMSFVAHLAGEGHTDRPRCASPVIRNMAILVNDRMPPETRQRLKVFVPRIVGTNDGMDGLRAALLCRTVLGEIVPRMLDEAPGRRAAGRRRSLVGRLWNERAKRALTGQMVAARLKLVLAAGQGVPLALGERIGRTAGHLIALCANGAPTAEDEAWYWDMAIGLLDQLCDIGAQQRGPTLQAQGLETLSGVPMAHRLEDAFAEKSAAPFRFGSLFPWWTAGGG